MSHQGKLAKSCKSQKKPLETGSLPFWDKSCQEISQQLWLDTKTDLQGLVETSLNGYVNKTIANSWFSVETSYLQNAKWLKMCDMKSCD
ncbi:MAG: hypothetical protein EAZ09_03015 [Oscillatoriales cyanobacterium]|nr:MAG: hypothetical protein EAZ09_03015 [Oscillatoriales cyanobacterium]